MNPYNFLENWIKKNNFKALFEFLDASSEEESIARMIELMTILENCKYGSKVINNLCQLNKKDLCIDDYDPQIDL